MNTAKIISEYNNLEGKKITTKELRAFNDRMKAFTKKSNDYKDQFSAIIKRVSKIVAIEKENRVLEIILTPIEKKKPTKPKRKKKAQLKGVDVLSDDDVYGLEQDAPEGEQLSGLGFTQDGQAKIYDMVTKLILEAIEKGGLFWRKPWNVKVSHNHNESEAINYATKTYYNGANFWITNFVVPSLGYKSRYFMTFNQTKKLNGSIKKGSRSFPVVYYGVVYSVSKPKKGSISESEYKSMSSAERIARGAYKLPFIQYYSVFNGDDIEGIEFKEIESVKILTEKEKIESCEAIVAGMPQRPPINHGGDRAFYTLGRDMVQMPQMETFEKEQEYYGTLFHELAHSTGHPDRIGRTFGKRFGDLDYAKEELVAELTSSYLCAEAGTLYFTLNQTAAYIKSWTKNLQEFLKEDSKLFLRTAAQAQKACDFILDISNKKFEPVKEVEVELAVAGIEPEPSKPKSKNINGIVDAKSIGSLNFKRIELTGKYREDFLKMFADTLIMIWGMPGHGKTVYLLLFAQYLAETLGLNVLYIANEEMGRSTLTEKINDFNIGHDNLSFTKRLPKSIEDWDVVLIDSVQSVGLNLEKFKEFVEHNPGKMIIIIAQATKDGDFRGGKDWEHEVDIAGEIINRKLVLRKNRLDPDFAKKSEKLMIDETVKKKKSDHIIKEKVKATISKKNIEAPKLETV
jgi:antirestriction protein ArdC